jgi:hypothetical protein
MLVHSMDWPLQFFASVSLQVQNVQVDLLILPRQHGLLCAADAVFGECRPFDDAVADLPRATDVQPPVVHRVK